METENRLQQEIKELRLLVHGLSRISGFPTELLELISLRAENIFRLVSTEPDITDTPVLANDTNVIIASEVVENITTIREPIHETRIAGSARNLNDVISQPVRVNDRQEPKRLVDISKLLTLNDRFRFQREFFGNDAQKMTNNLAALNQLASLEDALALFRDICPLGEESDCFPDFYMMLEQWFPQKPADAR